MNFQKLFGPFTKPREDVFDDIIGHENIKRLFGLALGSQGANHILLSGPPASAKTMFLLSLRHHLKNSYFIDGLRQVFLFLVCLVPSYYCYNSYSDIETIKLLLSIATSCFHCYRCYLVVTTLSTKQAPSINFFNYFFLM